MEPTALDAALPCVAPSSFNSCTLASYTGQPHAKPRHNRSPTSSYLHIRPVTWTLGEGSKIDRVCESQAVGRCAFVFPRPRTSPLKTLKVELCVACSMNVAENCSCIHYPTTEPSRADISKFLAPIPLVAAMVHTILESRSSPCGHRILRRYGLQLVRRSRSVATSNPRWLSRFESRVSHLFGGRRGTCQLRI
jgi:hypothetical protein